MKEDLYSDKIRTFTGKYVDVFNPDPDTIDILDIAHSLAQQPRFGGHLPKFYSVAQHSVYCAILADPEHKFSALMHDAAEAYLLDIPRPIKNRLTGYKEIEDNLMAVIAKKFGVEYPKSKQVNDVDERMLLVEWRNLMLGIEPVDMECWTSVRAEYEFLEAFKRYKK